jgi:ferrochelatase
MAYGTPETLDQVEPYFTHIRGGRTPSPEAVARLKQRYERVGGKTPLLEITRAVASGLETLLNATVEPGQAPYRVYVGMKHWHPFIAETMQTIVADGVEELTAVTLAPHYSRASIGGYRKAMDEAQAALGSNINVTFVESWHQQPEFVEFMGQLVRQGLEQFPADVRDRVVAVFSAHSLPVRIREWNDPYEQELLQSSESVAKVVGLQDWRFAWQSAGETGEPWLGPDILDYLETLHAEGVRQVLQVPIGFVSDHLEILWDLDVEAKTKSTELGITYHRTQLPNANPAFIRALSAVVTTANRSKTGAHVSA